EPLWTNSQFGGMPAYQMNTRYPNNWIGQLEPYSKLKLPSGLGLIFMLFLGFYFLSVYLKNDTWISVIGAFAFAFSTYFIVSLEGGHTGKLRVIGYMALVLTGVLMTMRGHKFLGSALTCIFLSLAINANHFQITYYLALMIMAYMIIEFIYHFKEKLVKSYLIKSAFLVFAALLAVGPNTSRLWTTQDYAKETMRGGQSELTDYQDAKSGGLEKDYAMRWSYGITETMTFLIPDFYGRSSTASLKEDSNTGKELKKRGIPKNQLSNILKYLPLYWGDQPFVQGPVFMGSLIIFLFVLSIFIVKGRIKVWLIVCTIFSVVLSWGSNFEVVTDLFFYYFPLYNKFRTPSMFLSLTCLTIPLLAMLALGKLIESPNTAQSYLPEIKKAFYITGGICLFFALFGTSLFSFSGSSDGQLPEGWSIESLIEDRKDLMVFGAFKALFFVSAGFGMLLYYSRNKLSKKYLILGLGLLVAVDIWSVDKTYLNEDNLVKRRSVDDFYVDTPIDQLILQDKGIHYRVFNVAGNPFNDAMTSFHHKSVGGYHGAKLIRYQDMIDRHLSKNNSKALDMLNTKYYIISNRETGQREVRQNPNALGNAWFVDSVIWAQNADEEIELLNQFQPSKEVVIDERFRDYSIGLDLNSEKSTIVLNDYQPNKLTYQASVYGGDQFAVFSEIYYEGTDHDWKAKIDGKDIQHIRVNYLLRGLTVPSGDHTIEFSFEPRSYFEGERLSLIFSILVFSYLFFAIFMEYRSRQIGN
ncbi:MAG: hypothetical protein RID18_16810, partial [Cytophagales bacterium]